MDYLLDILIGLPLLYMAYKGAVNGIVKELLNIIGVVLAVYGTFTYMDEFAAIISTLFEDPSQGFIPFLAGAILFIGVLSIISLLAYWMRAWLEAVNLGTANRFLGAIFGMLKAAIIISTLLILLSGFNIPKEDIRSQSVLYPYVIQVGPKAFNVVTTLYPAAENYTETLKNTLKNYNPIQNLPVINEEK
jgi:membrane protein required for colicin V production